MPKAKSTAALHEFKAFQGLSDLGEATLARGLRFSRYERRTTILSKDQKVSGAFVVVRGQLRVYTVTPDGNEATLYLIRPGETCVLAVNCVFQGAPYPAWVDAAAGTTVAVIAGAHYRTLFDSEASIRDLTLQAFSSAVFALMRELEGIHSLKLEQRLARFLLTHRAADGAVRMTQQEIASHLGTTREVVARVLGRWVARERVATRRGAVVIEDPVRLQEWLGADQRGFAS